MAWALGEALVGAAEGGDAEAQYAVGRALERGEGAGVDLVSAARWYCAAAERGHAGALEALLSREWGMGCVPAGTWPGGVEPVAADAIEADLRPKTAAGASAMAHMLAGHKVLERLRCVGCVGGCGARTDEL